MQRFNGLLPALAAAAMLGAAGSAVADEPVSMSVDYDVKELTTETGREAVRARIARAADDVCRIHGVSRAAEHSMRQQCKATAIADAEAALELRIAQLERERRIRTAEARH
ncbi:MAG: UrcA family protein [Oceanicaulis sp.]